MRTCLAAPRPPFYAGLSTSACITWPIRALIQSSQVRKYVSLQLDLNIVACMPQPRGQRDSPRRESGWRTYLPCSSPYLRASLASFCGATSSSSDPTKAPAARREHVLLSDPRYDFSCLANARLLGTNMPAYISRDLLLKSATDAPNFFRAEGRDGERTY